jgi:hypothetical protein
MHIMQPTRPNPAPLLVPLHYQQITRRSQIRRRKNEGNRAGQGKQSGRGEAKVSCSLSGPSSWVTASMNRSWRSAVHRSRGLGSAVSTTLGLGPPPRPCVLNPPPREEESASGRTRPWRIRPENISSPNQRLWGWPQRLASSESLVATRWRRLGVRRAAAARRAAARDGGRASDISSAREMSRWLSRTRIADGEKLQT